jgi:methylenetetrahydrofolate reductase (NADPH)
VSDCPKRMRFGPCGGVQPDESCEMRAMPCVFPDVVPWTDAPVPSVPLRRIPRVITDFSAPQFDPQGAAAVARILGASCDAVLVGEHQNRPDFPPTVLAQRLLAAGARPWITLACRDRNRVVLEQELRGLQAVGVEAALCVTGDGRGYDVRPGVTQVFDLDSFRLTALAASLGMTAVVAETPTAPPMDQRPARLVHKQRAGAAVAVLNHVSTPAQVAAFVADARTGGLMIPVLAAVAVFTDAPSAAVLQGLPGLALDDAAVGTVLDSDDPIAAGIEAAVAEAHELLAIDGVSGINVSGLGSAAGYEAAAEIKAEVGRRVLEAMT